MSVFTITLCDLIDRNPTGLERDEFLNLHNYPIFDEAYRAGLNQKIIDHYWNREIAHETWQQFVFNLGREMREIMPLMNLLYESERITYDPLKTVSLKTTAANEATQDSSSIGNSTNATNNTSHTESVTSDTPQTQLAEDEDYATGSAQANTSSASNASANETGSATVKSEQATDSETSGYQGVPANMIIAMRASFLNLDRDVIDQLKTLFFGLWNNDDEQLPPNWRGFY